MTTLALLGREKFPACPENARAVRVWLTVKLAKALPGLHGDTVASIVMCADEFFGNVVRHSRSGVPDLDKHVGTAMIKLLVDDHATVRVEVTDGGPVKPWPGPDDELGDDLEHGRGLLIVESLSKRWGHNEGRDWQTVWCEISP